MSLGGPRKALALPVCVLFLSSTTRVAVNSITGSTNDYSQSASVACPVFNVQTEPTRLLRVSKSGLTNDKIYLSLYQ